MPKKTTIVKGRGVVAKAESTALAQAVAFVAAKKESTIKVAKILAASTSLTAETHANLVKALKSVATRGSAIREGLRAEFRGKIASAADGEEISDDYTQASEALAAIVTTAESGMDVLALEETEAAVEEVAADTEVEAADEDTTAAESDEVEASEETEAAVEEPVAAVAKKKASKHTAEEVLDKLIDGLTDLVEEIQTLSSGEDTVEIDENGVVQDDTNVDDVLDEDTVPEDGIETENPEELPEDDDNLHAALDDFIAGELDEATASDEEVEAASEGDEVTASDDPYKDNNQADPLKGKTAKKAAVQRTASRIAADQHKKDVDNLTLICADLVR